MNSRTDWIETLRRNAQTRLKWILSALSAALTASFVVTLEANF
jgi:hypothetical protein